MTSASGQRAMKDEVDVLPVLRTALQQGKKVLIPRIIDGTCDMEFYYLTDEPNSQTESNKWGIAEPKTELEKCVMDDLLPDLRGDEILVLVPGLAFGKDNSRLGRGKGFYDRFLSELKKKTAAQGKERPWICGICYRAQIVESVPVDENDVRMDVVL